MSTSATLVGILTVIVMFGGIPTGLWGVGYIIIVVIAGFVLAVIATCIVLARTRGTVQSVKKGD